MDRPYNLLFLCTGNSARSILAEALANQMAKGRFHAYSAGSHPRGRVHPMALQVLEEAGIATDGLRSKPWDEFATPEAPQMDLIITVCDKAAGEACPLWPGHPVTAHWGIEDPASVAGSQEQVHKAFGKALQLLQHRLSLLMTLKPEALDRLALETRVREIGAAS
jgi:arsenate reductase